MKPAKLLTILICLAALPMLVLGGCGGGDDTTTAAAKEPKEQTTLGKAELISQGDAICGEVNAAVGAVAAGEEGSEGAIKVAGLYIGMVESLKQLGEPQETEGYDEFIESADALSQSQSDAKLAAERGESAEASTAAIEEFEAQAAIYGFEACSEEAAAVTPIEPGAGGEEAAPEFEEEGGIEAAPEVEEEAPEEEAAPEEAPEVEVAPETGGAGGGIEEAPEEEVAPEEEGNSGGVGPG